jgi:type II secretory ATPase GspE/PulE/Tfp pilus assembly ATPase PilB-like protein
MAQRLVRTLCPNSGKPVPVDDSIKLIIDSEFKDIPEAFRSEIPVGDTVYEIEPTPACPKGTSGRTAVFEVIDMTKELEKVILKDPTEIEVTKTARNQGMFTMKEDAIIKAFKRSIPFEEVNKL